MFLDIFLLLLQQNGRVSNNVKGGMVFNRKSQAASVCMGRGGIFHFMEIHSGFWLYLHNGLEILTKFGSSNPNFNKSILSQLCLKFKTSAHAQISIIKFLNVI